MALNGSGWTLALVVTGSDIVAEISSDWIEPCAVGSLWRLAVC